MTKPPLPPSNVVRVRLVYTNSDSYEAGSRFYLSFTGSAPSAANCATLATDIASAWNTDIAPQMHVNWALTEVDVLDITTDSGASGQWTGSHAGSGSGGICPASAAVNTEYEIARRYRGGKPRIFWPPPPEGALASAAAWSSTFLTAMSTAVDSFFSDVTGLSVGSMGVLAHVNLSYYSGFTNVTNSSGRTRAAPKYRTTPVIDSITGYLVKATVGSQRRRRTATTP